MKWYCYSSEIPRKRSWKSVAMRSHANCHETSLPVKHARLLAQRGNGPMLVISPTDARAAVQQSCHLVLLLVLDRSTSSISAQSLLEQRGSCRLKMQFIFLKSDLQVVVLPHTWLKLRISKPYALLSVQFRYLLKYFSKELFFRKKCLKNISFILKTPWENLRRASQRSFPGHGRPTRTFLENLKSLEDKSCILLGFGGKIRK